MQSTYTITGGSVNYECSTNGQCLPVNQNGQISVIQQVEYPHNSIVIERMKIGGASLVLLVLMFLTLLIHVSDLDSKRKETIYVFKCFANALLVPISLILLVEFICALTFI